MAFILFMLQNKNIATIIKLRETVINAGFLLLFFENPTHDYPLRLFPGDFKFQQQQQLSVVRVRAIGNLSVIRIAALAYPSEHARSIMYTLNIIVNIKTNSSHARVYSMYIVCIHVH